MKNPPNTFGQAAREASPSPVKIVCLFLALLSLAAALPQARAQVTLVLTNRWSLAPGSRFYLPTSGNNPRGMAINRSTGNVLIPSLVNSNHIHVVRGSDGADLGGLATGSGIISGGTLALMHVGVTDDGVVYACNLDNAAGVFTIYRWSAEDLSGATQPVVAFGPAAPGPNTTRIGDSFFVRGSGTGTQIIASGTSSGYFTVFTTTDGTNFTPKQIAIPSVPGAGGLNRTVAFDGANNAFWGGKPNDTFLYYITFDLNALTATTLSNITFSPPMGMCGVNSVGGIPVLAGIKDDGFVTSASRSLLIYDMRDLSAPAFGGNVAFPAGGPLDGNITGQAAVGSGLVAALSTHGGVVALGASLQANAPPSITTAPVGATGIYPTYTLTVGASGTPPLRYQWLASNAQTNTASTFTNIPGATTNVYSLAVATTNYFEVIITNAYGSVTSTPVLVSLLPAVTSTVVTQLWRIAAGANGYPYLSPTDNATRGLGYDANSNRVVISSMSGGAAIYLLDGDTGTNLGRLDLSSANLSGGTFGIDQVGVADDGAVYSGNLALAGQTFQLNRWPSASTNATAFNAYNDGSTGILAASGDRWGDIMAVRGSGPNAQVLLGSRSGTNVALLTTTDGQNFSPSVIAITNAPAGFAANGIAFGAGNTLWAKASQGHLFQVAFDPVALTGGKISDFVPPSQTPTYMVGVGVDPIHNILAGIDLADVPDDLKLFQLTGTADPPVLFDQAFFASNNANGNANAAIAMKSPRVYGLDVNNGVVALTYGVPPTTPPVITARPVDQTVYTNIPAATLSASVSGSLPLYYQWRSYGPSTSNVPANIPGATNSSYVLNYPPVSASGYYDVIVRNIAGSATSAPPTLLTVIAPTTSTVVTQLWTLAPGSRPYLDGSTYNTRGLAYDTNTGSVLVADHFNIYLLAATNGSDLGQLNSLGLPIGGVNGWTVDQLGVADDGVLYSCNLSLDGSGFAIVSWPSISPGAAAGNYAFGGSTGADPSGTGDRWGDTMSVRGSAMATEILCGSSAGTRVVLFTTSDGTTFAPVVINVTNAPAGFAGQGIAFGAGDTFWAKSPGFNLRLVSFDRATGVGGVVQTYTAGTQVPSNMDGISVDVANNILAGVVFDNTPNDMELFLLSGNTNPPSLFEQVFFGANNINSQLNAATVLKGGLGFGLDVNNGLVALAYGIPPLGTFPITSVTHAGTSTSITWLTFNGRKYQVQYKNALTDATWTSIGPLSTATGATASYTDNTSSGTARYYRVVGQ